MSLPYNDLTPMGQSRRGFTGHSHSPTDQQHQQPPPPLRSENTSSTGHGFAQPSRSPARASLGIDRDAKFASSRNTTTPYSSGHSSPASIDRHLRPATILNSNADFLPPLHNQGARRSSTSSSSKLPFDVKQEQHSDVILAKEPSNCQTAHQGLRSGQTYNGSASSGISSIPNLLGPDRADGINGIMFRLSMRQQPQAARACGFGDRDRRVIDPPPIVQLFVNGPSLSRDDARSYLRYESYVMNCSICDESGTQDASFMPEEYQHQRRLMGSLVGTPFVGQDDHGEEGCFFCFSDLSCRTPGAFRLKFTLVMIDPARAGVIRHFPVLTEIVSDIFHVYSAKEFPGMLPSSNLAKRLKEQGCIISIKKGNDRSKNARAQSGLSDEEETGEGSQGQRKRRTIRD